MIFKLFRKESEQEKSAVPLYAAIVAQSRQPALYQDYSVEDSVTGRFEMIMLHAYVLFYRLREEDEKAKELGQAVFNHFFLDMDHSLREQGVGDLSVPKKIKKMAQSFYGRVDAYDEAREQGQDALTQALSRNVFPNDEAVRDEASGLAKYVLANGEVLAAQSVKSFAKGKIEFAEIPDYQAAEQQE